MRIRSAFTLAVLIGVSSGCGSDGLSSRQQSFNTYNGEVNAVRATEVGLLIPPEQRHR